MIQLYDRYAAVVREVLTVAADCIQGKPDALTQLMNWTDTRDAGTTEVAQEYPST